MQKYFTGSRGTRRINKFTFRLFEVVVSDGMYEEITLMSIKSRLCLVVMALVCLSVAAAATQPLPDELAQCRCFVSARIEAITPRSELTGGLTVLLAENAGIAIQQNLRNGQPLRIGGREFRRGIFCHANSRFRVSLPSPGKSFSAIVGIDSNELKGTGSGTAIFSVQLGGKEAYKSKVMREGMPAEEVRVDLAGATEFIIDAIDAGDGIGYDHSAWADARVTLADGNELWLGDLPFLLGQWAPVLTADPPFSFSYNGKPSKQFLDSWTVNRQKHQLDANRSQFTLTWTDPNTGLELRCLGIEYLDFPTVEWTIYLKNTGSADTPIIENIQALNLTLEPGPEGKLTLNHTRGSFGDMHDFMPRSSPLDQGCDIRFTTLDAFPTSDYMSYFNIERPGGGLIVAIGWPARWAAEFKRKNESGLRVFVGQEHTRLKLLPGEEIRTPLVALQFWTGNDRVRSQNIWRRWMIAHNLPRPGGKLPSPIFAGQYPSLGGTNGEGCISFIDEYVKADMKPDYWWIDAGWYPNTAGDWQECLGTWQPDEKRFPHGLRAVSDHAHANGIKLLVWFEPERVQPGSWLYEQHPEWLIGPMGGTRQLDFGNPDALKWAIDFFDKFFTDQGIDLYRQDYCNFPTGKWSAMDSDDRRGIAENRFVVGYLAFLDEILRRHPNMLMDTCAAGGRRLDLEHLRRAVPMWRSDYPTMQVNEAIGMQCQTYGLAQWVPYFGTMTGTSDPYSFRSYMCPSIVGWYDFRQPVDVAGYKRMISQWRRISPDYYGDYYPLTPYTAEPQYWIAWQFDSTEKGQGFVQAFRREKSIYVTAELTLMGLDPAARYTLTDLDTDQSTEHTGKELIEKGFTVSLPGKPSSALIAYQKQR